MKSIISVNVIFMLQVYVVLRVQPSRIVWWFGDWKTPVPIPNTVVKTARGDNTRTVRSREDSFLPGILLKHTLQALEGVFLREFVFSIIALI
jgi:hypothetical protein